ncbi:hypothetical protein FACS1894159_00340 [Bacteroidia bacterium]|nr:hypothetical protein FACS1894159_00340 [Bacteroidia bacterium]
MKGIKFPATIRTIIACCAVLATMSQTSCNKFLNIVPDDIPTVDHAFTNANEAEKFLFTCYSYLPQSGRSPANIGQTAGDEFWFARNKRIAAPAWDQIAKGLVNADNPAPDFWCGSDYTIRLFVGMRDCNTFISKLEDRSLVRDLSDDQRARWIAEAKFLKAYYHFFLLRYYGPIPITDKATPISSDPSTVQVRRESIDACVKYIADLLDECYLDLPLVISNTYRDLGHITKPINRALKAKTLLMAASPLFNGNDDYASFRNIDGTLFFNQTEDRQKWVAAAEAAKEAINVAHSAGHKLYEFALPSASNMSLTEPTMIQMSIRHAVCEKWNSEIIWGLSGGGRAGDAMQNYCMAKVDLTMVDSKAMSSMAPPLHIIRQFHTRNGVPIAEDKTLDFSDPLELRTAVASDAANIAPGYTTARLNFDRENRFYASVGFDGGRWVMAYHPSASDINNYFVDKSSNSGIEGCYSMTGYYAKKLVNWNSQFFNNTSSLPYSWPEIRLSDVYLMYAEALNETLDTPSADVYEYIDLVRERAGLKGVVESWANYSLYPNRALTQEGMRNIIRQERLIELAFEGSRYWDLLRWKLAQTMLDTPITGWDVSQPENNAYYKIRTIAHRQFVAPRDYFMPIPNKDIRKNPSLVQNPGW